MDDDLIERARQGDSEAMGQLYERHAARVYAIVRRLAGDDATAEDLAQEAWMRVFRALPSFRGEARFTTWLHRVAVNAALHGQRTSRRRGLLSFPGAQLPEMPGRPDQPLLRLQLERAIDRLPGGMRRVLVLHDVEGYKHEEIAEMLGISAGTCKSQLFKARAKLRELLEPQPALMKREEAWSI
jgi:RNA polymerase sigma-70 factor, ECF subfamily